MVILLSVQLRPMVRNMAKALLHDVSMLERLYTGPNAEGMSKTMLNVSSLPTNTVLAFTLIAPFVCRFNTDSRGSWQSSLQTSSTKADC